jgi:hypothetical protein
MVLVATPSGHLEVGMDRNARKSHRVCSSGANSNLVVGSCWQKVFHVLIGELYVLVEDGARALSSKILA